MYKKEDRFLIPEKKVVQEFTPGPWDAFQMPDGIYVGLPWNLESKKRFFIAKVVWNDKRYANAFLIKSAPDYVSAVSIALFDKDRGIKPGGASDECIEKLTDVFYKSLGR